jgi:uncharacterized protein (TIGR03067 family)
VLPLTQARITVTGNRLAVLEKGRRTEAFDLTVHAKAKPKGLDLKDVKRGAVVVLAVYSLRGDTLTICTTSDEKARPRDVSGGGPKDNRLTFKRVKKR